MREKDSMESWNKFFEKLIDDVIAEEMKRRDAVEVIRCKDCTLWGKIACPMHNSVFPGTTEECYCCFGERLEDDA